MKYNLRRDRPIKWQGRRTSRNIDDRRRSGGTSRKSGVTGIEAVIALIIGWYFGVDVSGFVDTGNTGITTSQSAEIT
jgi:predicted metalloprotease